VFGWGAPAGGSGTLEQTLLFSKTLGTYAWWRNQVKVARSCPQRGHTALSPERQCGRSELSVGDSDRHKVPGGGGGFLQNAPCTCGVCVGTVQTKQELGGLSRDQCGLMRSARALKFGGDAAGLEVQNLSPGRTEPHCCTQIDWGARTLHVSL
jgi:hypothetical protein